MLVRYCSIIAVLAILTGGCSGPQPEQPTQSPQSAQPALPASEPTASVSIEKKEWYEGGNLHRALMREWKTATYENKLATSADMVAKIKKFSSIDEMKTAAVELEQCISKVAEGPEAERQPVSDIAAACAILMGYR